MKGARVLRLALTRRLANRYLLQARLRRTGQAPRYLAVQAQPVVALE